MSNSSTIRSDTDNYLTVSGAASEGRMRNANVSIALGNRPLTRYLASHLRIGYMQGSPADTHRSPSARKTRKGKEC